ncbi:MAG: NADH-quinone oxidoreductase subunit NuoE family protein [Candidatus Geothermincolia bacterium]
MKEGCECGNKFADIDDPEPLNDILERYGKEKGSLIRLLQETQEAYGYLDQKLMRGIAKGAGYQLSQVYGMATFYAQFRLEPIGKNLIRICLGTACHVRNANGLVEEATRLLGIEPGETTEDMMFTLETVNCLGACALAPLAIIDDKYYGQMNPRKMEKTLRNIAKSEEVES